MLSAENYELRERLLKKDSEIGHLKTEKENTQDGNVLQKFLRKENSELHNKMEELKLERNRLRHSSNEKQEKIEKLSEGSSKKINRHFSIEKTFHPTPLPSPSAESFLLMIYNPNPNP